MRRIRNLSSAVERFRPWGFTRTFELIYSVTGASPGTWTPEQLDLAARLIDDAQTSWAIRAREEQERAREAKRRPGYKPVSMDQLVDEWRADYTSRPVNRALWHLPVE